MVRHCRSIDITIEDANLKVETHGYVGDECDEIEVIIREFFGKRPKSKRTLDGKRKKPHRVRNKETDTDHIRE